MKKKSKTHLEEKEKLESLIKSENQSYLISNFEGSILQANKNALDLTGYEREELIGMNIGHLFYKNESGYFNKGAEYQYKTILHPKNGISLPVELTSDEVYWKDEKYKITFIRELTERIINFDKNRSLEKRYQLNLDDDSFSEIDMKNVKLKDIIDSSKLQSIMNDFNKLTDIPMAIIDLEGNVLVGAGWRDVCTLFHRTHPITRKNCIESDIFLSSESKPGEYLTYKCKNNLWDIATPIMVAGKRMGHFFLGQFFYEDEEIDYDFFSEQAKKYGFNEEQYLSALNKIPRWSREKVKTVMDFYTKFASIISNLSYNNIKLMKLIQYQKIAKKQLSESEERFREVVHRSPIGIGIVDEEGHLIDCNEAIAEMLGYTRDELLDLNFGDFTHPEDLEKEWKLIQAMWANKRDGYNMIKRYIHRNGKTIWVDLAGSIIRDVKGKPKFGFAFVQDITERKEAEEKLKKSEELFRTVFSTAEDCIFIKDTSLKYTKINRAMEKLFDIKEKELFGKTDIELFGESVAKRIIEEDKQVLKGNISEEITSKPVGEILHTFHTIKVPLKDSEGEVYGICGIARDITERRKTERQLDTILRMSTDTIARFDKNLRHLYINPIVEEELGIKQEEFLGKTNRELGMPESVVNGWEKALISVFNSGKEKRYEVCYPTPDGDMDYYENKIIPELDDDGNVKTVLTITRNITNRKKMEQRIQSAYDRAEFYKDLLAHDMGNILNNIKSSTQLMELWKNKESESMETLEMINTIKDQAERGALLISNVRKLSMIEKQEHTIKSVDPIQLLKKSIKNIKKRFKGRDIEFSLYFPEDTLAVKGNDLLLDVFDNLLINGIVHNERDQIKLWIKVLRTNENQKEDLRMEFEDNGIGIEEERKIIVFNRSPDKDKTTGGMGIGLSLVKKIIKSYNGSIWVEDRIKGDSTRGSKFVVLLTLS
ncbi:MAG: PAS domain S-box protein [Candidatus Lokiarchaeota archaeon]|nr:PAS domain S-box protein [Candidatus Lokiarchaeota archaeon]MBD3342674.1 PAS domain S-box protein [Candidatus Lokiarchaeota archaeon]